MLPELEHLRERLLRAGAKPGLVSRYVAELADHFEDLSESETRETALRRLGSPEVLAAALLAQPGARSWTGRAPWATLALAPIAALVLGHLLPALVLFLAVRAFAADLDYGRGALAETWPFAVLRALDLFGQHVLPILVGWIAAAVALRQRAEFGWLLPGAAATAFLGGGLFMVVAWQTGHPANVQFGIGLRYADLLTDIGGRSLESGLLNLCLILLPFGALRMLMARGA